MITLYNYHNIYKINRTDIQDKLTTIAPILEVGRNIQS